MDDEGGRGRAVAAGNNRMGELVGDDGQEEAERADQPDRPRDQRIHPGLEVDEPTLDRHGHDRHDEQPRDVEADLEPEDARDRDPVHRTASGAAPAIEPAAADPGACAARFARRPAATDRMAAAIEIDPPDGPCVGDAAGPPEGAGVVAGPARRTRSAWSRAQTRNPSAAPFRDARCPTMPPGLAMVMCGGDWRPA